MFVSLLSFYNKHRKYSSGKMQKRWNLKNHLVKKSEKYYTFRCTRTNMIEGGQKDAGSKRNINWRNASYGYEYCTPSDGGWNALRGLTVRTDGVSGRGMYGSRH